MAYDNNLQLLASTTVTSTSQGSGVSLRNPSTTSGTNVGGTPRRGLKARAVVTAASGTTPTMALVIQHSDDNSTYTDLAVCLTASITTTGEYYFAFDTDKPWVRLKYTIAGTNPSFTLFADIGNARP